MTVQTPSPSDGSRTGPINEALLEAYWVERQRYIQEIRKIPEIRRRFYRELMIYILRRLLWSFFFFPVFIAFWVPLVLSNFNLVILIQGIMPMLQDFLDSAPQTQAATVEMLLIAWLSVGFAFAVFDLILTPFRSPYEYEADVHMRIWEELQRIGQSETTPSP
ncbi:hypothetical protein AAIA72_05555 [Hahella sp. SMD15-11]|uniref:Uncharacterized protein n=1 Tax=Thermohahella caldifontis TaxID=3142973 RepID=A0AB39UZI4_9GAMM